MRSSTPISAINGGVFDRRKNLNLTNRPFSLYPPSYPQLLPSWRINLATQGTQTVRAYPKPLLTPSFRAEKPNLKKTIWL